jgi:protein-tyrosine phosphatase
VIRVLFVCLGNICRSPMAHGVLRDLVRQRGLQRRIGVDSCGTSGYHNGEPPDGNMIAVAAGHGVRIGDLVSRRLQDADYYEFDLIVPMDGANERDVRARAFPNSEARIVRFTDFVADDVFDGDGVPDPYYGGIDGFEKVYRIVVDGCERVLALALELEAERA